MAHSGETRGRRTGLAAAGAFTNTGLRTQSLISGSCSCFGLHRGLLLPASEYTQRDWQQCHELSVLRSTNSSCWTTYTTQAYSGFV